MTSRWGCHNCRSTDSDSSESPKRAVLSLIRERDSVCSLVRSQVRPLRSDGNFSKFHAENVHQAVALMHRRAHAYPIPSPSAGLCHPVRSRLLPAAGCAERGLCSLRRRLREAFGKYWRVHGGGLSAAVIPDLFRKIGRYPLHFSQPHALSWPRCAPRRRSDRLGLAARHGPCCHLLAVRA